MDIITACFIGNSNKWTIYRPNFEEITFYVREGVITASTKLLTRDEISYIISENINLSKKNMIINYGARGYSDINISNILSIPIYEIKPIMIKYWKNKNKL